MVAMISILLFFGLLFCHPIYGGLTKANYQALAPLVQASASIYPSCVFLGDNNNPAPYFIWNLDTANNKLNAAMHAINTGWMAFGVTRQVGNINPMYNTDVVMGTLPGQGYLHQVDDYVIGNQRSTSLDTSAGGTDDVTGNFTFFPTTSITSFYFTRNITSTDAFDANLMPGQKWQYLWSMSIQGNTGLFHDNGYSAFFVDLAAVPNCPSFNGQICAGAGTCMHGCCICNNGSYGFDCSGGQTNNIVLNATVNPADYIGHYVDQTGNFNLYWKTIGDQFEVGIVLTGTGWVAFGPSANGLMIGSDVIVAWYDPVLGPQADDYFMTAQAGVCPGVCKDTDLGGSNDVLAVNGSQSNGVTQLKWRRKLVTADTNADYPISINTFTTVVYGFQSLYPGPNFYQHDSNTKGAISVNFLTGQYGQLTPIYAIAHGLAMFLAWAFLIPIGACVGKYLKQFKWWFNIHRIINSLALALVLAGFVLAVLFTTSHLYTYHSIIGIIVVLLGFSQPVIGNVADKWYKPERNSPPAFPDVTHWIIGWVSLLAGIANVGIGINQYNQNYGGSFYVLVAYIVYAGLVGLTLLGLFIWKVVKTRNGYSKESFAFTFSGTQ